MIPLHEFVVDYVYQFDRCRYEYDAERGFIVWRLGTGRNVELLHVRSFVLRQGNGRRLVYKMLDKLAGAPPYFSVYGFTRTSNERAGGFYESLGFKLQPVEGLYKDGTAVMFWADYRTLMERKKWYEYSVRSQAR